MSGSRTQIHRFKARSRQFSDCGTAISIHSHTMHSKEYLSRLPHYIAKFPIGSYILEREIGRVHLYEGRIFNFNKIYWTPPLSPREAYELECKQIEGQLGRKALVSLSDHDNVAAGMRLRLLEKTRTAPISVEWTVPYGKTEFHIGVHNLPISRAGAWMKEFAIYRAKPDGEVARYPCRAERGKGDAGCVEPSILGCRKYRTSAASPNFGAVSGQISSLPPCYRTERDAFYSRES